MPALRMGIANGLVRRTRNWAISGPLLAESVEDWMKQGFT